MTPVRVEEGEAIVTPARLDEERVTVGGGQPLGVEDVDRLEVDDTMRPILRYSHVSFSSQKRFEVVNEVME